MQCDECVMMNSTSSRNVRRPNRKDDEDNGVGKLCYLKLRGKVKGGNEIDFGDQRGSIMRRGHFSKGIGVRFGRIGN
jgi:hypothetical protein